MGNCDPTGRSWCSRHVVSRAPFGVAKDRLRDILCVGNFIRKVDGQGFANGPVEGIAQSRTDPGMDMRVLQLAGELADAVKDYDVGFRLDIPKR